ncbi:unnamed protein product [Durusdinium trenchii]|uniref:Uncharacterized protein n=1 Tax=Durusdinium trenchii TaxID=1381693 RepID=A0ABP0LHK9_9DINO
MADGDTSVFELMPEMTMGDFKEMLKAELSSSREGIQSRRTVKVEVMVNGTPFQRSDGETVLEAGMAPEVEVQALLTVDPIICCSRAESGYASEDLVVVNIPRTVTCCEGLTYWEYPTVIPHGAMAKATELNGLQCTLWRLDTESGRWEVKLPDGEVKALRPVHLIFRGIGPIEDDGSLTLIGMASEHQTIHRVLDAVRDLIRSGSEALALLGSVVSPLGGRKALGEEGRIWLKLGKQAEQRVRGTLEELQKNMEQVDSIDASRYGPKAAAEIRLARKDLVQFVQKAQEQLESALTRLRVVLQHLVSTVPAHRPAHGWTEEESLHEKYRAAFEKLEEVVEQTDAAKKTRLSGITVKFQGRGENPPPSDNLYVKGLPGWVTESDLESIFSEVGDIQSMKLKAADWGAIAFIRLANKAQAQRAIAKYHNRVPRLLEKKAEEVDAKKLSVEITKGMLRATVDQLARGVTVIIDLRKPLGCVFNDDLVTKSVQEEGQGFELGIRVSWRVRSIGGVKVLKTADLKERMGKLKAEGHKEAALVFSPPPIVASFAKRPFGFTVAKDADLGLIYVNASNGLARAQGVRPGALISNIGGTDVSALKIEQVRDMLLKADVPVTVHFEQARGLPNAVTGVLHPVPDEEMPAPPPAEVVDEGPMVVPPPVDLDIDLSVPLGIKFDDQLVVESVAKNSQAARLGIGPGWQALGLAGDELSTRKELEQKLEVFKAEGSLGQPMMFQPAPMPASRARELGASQAAAVLRARAADLEREAEEERKNMREVTLDLDLSQPLGILFNKFLEADAVNEGSQSAKLGIKPGWRAKSLAGEDFKETRELVAKIQALKEEGTLTVSAVFLAPADGVSVDAPSAAASAAASEPKEPKVEQEVPMVATDVTLDLSQPLGIGSGVVDELRNLVGLKGAANELRGSIPTMGTSVKERPPKKTSVIMPSSLLSAIVGEQAEPVRMRIAMAINYFKGTEPVSDIETLDLVVNVLLANFRDDIDDVKKFQGLVNTSASFATGALQGLAPGRTFVAPRPAKGRKSRGRGLKIARAVTLLQWHHGSAPPQRFANMSMVWECRHCNISMSQNSVYCRKCNTWWELCWRIPKKEQKDDKSKKKKGDQRSRSKSVHQEGKAASSSKDPLMPFVPLKEPWVSTTPDSRVKAEVHGAFPGPRLPGPKEPVSEMCDKIRTFLYHKKDKIPEELTSSLSDFVKEEDQMLKHSHVNKLANLRRAAEKLLVKIKTTDQEWTDFQKTLKDRFDSQKASYLKTRAGLVKQFKEKKQEFLDHRALVQSLAAGGDLGEDGDAPEDVTFGDLAQMPETVNLEEEEEEEDMSVDALGTKRDAGLHLYDELDFGSGLPILLSFPGFVTSTGIEGFTSSLKWKSLSPRQCWLVYLAYFDPFCHFLVEQCTFLLVLECRMFLLGSVSFDEPFGSTFSGRDGVMRPVVTSATVTFDEFVQAVEMVGVCVCFNLEMRWLECSLPWLHLKHWDGTGPYELHFYTDGSKVGELSGAAVALWVLCGTGWRFAGHLQHHLGARWGSYDAELAAWLMAGKWAFDLFRSLGFTWASTPSVFLHFDSTSAGFGVLGAMWGDTAHPIFRAARSIFQLFEMLWPGSLQPCFVRGHQGDPGNECVDVLSRHAALNGFDLDEAWSFFYNERGIAFKALPWLWLAFRADLEPFWHGGKLLLPATPVVFSEDVADTLEEWQQSEADGAKVWLDLCCLSYNAMTMKGKNTSCYVNVTHFLEECNARGASLVALQETRMKNQVVNNQHYWTLSHPSERGLGGVLMALHKTAGIFWEAGQFLKLQPQNWRLVVATPHLLLSRLVQGSVDILIGTFHAPHTGADKAAVSSFWRDFTNHIPQYLRHLPVILAGDANARIGSMESAFHGKSFFSEETKTMIGYKQFWRARLLQGRVSLRRFWLHFFFFVWKGDTGAPGWLGIQEEHLSHLHWCLAVFQWCFLTFRNWVTSLVRRDAKKFWEHLAALLPAAETSKNQRSWWRLVQQHLPKNQVKRLALSAERQDCLRDQWRPYLCELEAGSETSMTELYREIVMEHQGKKTHPPSREDLPSLLDVESALRTTRARKAPGPDGVPSAWLHFGPHLLAPHLFDLLLKSMVQCMEAVFWKGGVLKMIPKTVSPVQVQHFRGIMLLNLMPRRAHSLFRPMLMQELEKNRPVGQIGGLPHQEAAFGSHAMRLFVRCAYSLGLPTCLLFVDLKAAYHSLIRELVLGPGLGNGRTRQVLLQQLLREGYSFDAAIDLVENSGLLQQGFRRDWFRELHSFTWSSIVDEPVATNRGSRPGSPLADSLFHVAMAPVVSSIEEWLLGRPDRMEALEKLKGLGHSVVWADDLCIPSVSNSNDGLLEEVEATFQFVEGLFTKHGFTLNLSRGKTEGLPTFVGPGAAECRRRLLQNPVVHGHKDLQLGASYKHLGTYVDAAGELRRDIQVRVAVAWTSFRQLSRRLLRNPSLSLRARVALLDSLILSRLLYGAGSWGALTGKQYRVLNACYRNLLRQISFQVACKGKAQVWTDEAILCYLELPCLRVKLAVARLLYARRLAVHAPHFLLDSLQCERSTRPDSWLGAFEVDMEWLRAHVSVDGWGLTWLDLCASWRAGRPGWKRLVQQATVKYVLVKKMLHSQAPASVPGHNAAADCDAFECHCGASFTTSRALRSHQVHSHGVRAPEYNMLRHPCCPVCLRFFWTLPRAQAHLRYLSRSGAPNLCFEWLRVTGFVDLRDWVVGEFPDLPGIKRREALRLYGPHPCGAFAGDVEALEEDFMECRKSLRVDGVIFPLEEDLRERCFEVFETVVASWMDGMPAIPPQVEGVATGCATAALFLWGMQLKDRPLAELWFMQTLANHSAGETLRRMHNLAVWIQQLRKLDGCEPHRERYAGPANPRERHLRDLRISYSSSVQFGECRLCVRDTPLSLLRTLAGS